MLSGTRVSYKCVGIPFLQLLFFLYIHSCFAASWYVPNSIFSYLPGCTFVSCACCFFLRNFVGELSLCTLHTSANFLFVLTSVFMMHTFCLFYLIILRRQWELWQYSYSVVWWLNLCVIILGSEVCSLKPRLVWNFILKIPVLWRDVVVAYSLWCCWLKTCDNTFLSSSAHATYSLKLCNWDSIVWFQASTAKLMRTAPFWAITTTHCVLTQNNAVLR